MKTAIAVALLIPFLSLSQPKKIIDVPVHGLNHGAYGLSEQNAMRLYVMSYAENIPDTTIAIYVKQSLYWTGKMYHPHNYISNGNFDSTGLWHTTGSDTKFWVDAVGHYCGISFPTQSQNMQLYQFDSLKLMPSTTYRLSFKAWSRHGSTIETYVHKHEAPYTTLMGATIVLDSSQYQKYVPYQFQFSTDTSVSSQDLQRLRFWFLQSKPSDSIYFADIQIQELLSLPEQKIGFDSVMGRGANRLAMISVAMKIADSTRWKRQGFDTAGMLLVTPTRDSTAQWFSWMNYTYDIDPNCKLHVNQFEACRGFIWTRAWDMIGATLKMQMRLTKILGDPTVNQGRDQRALLRFRAYEDVNELFQNWIDTRSSETIPYWEWR